MADSGPAPEQVEVVYGYAVLQRRGRPSWQLLARGDKDDSEMPPRLPPARAFPVGTMISITVPTCTACHSELPSKVDSGCTCRDWSAWRDQFIDE